MNIMLISADAIGEIRVALVKDNLLYDLEIEAKESSLKKANIYKGRVTRVEPSLDAVFVDYGAERHGFLPLKEINRTYFKNKNSRDLRDLITSGQELIVQVDKDERGNKGAALTTFISLAGAYLVLMPNNPKVGGISRQIDGEEREELKSVVQSLSVPEGMGIIVRTAGLGRSLNELKHDLKGLVERWEGLVKLAETQSAPSLLHQEGNAAMRAIRDYLRQEIEEIWVEQEELFYKVKDYIKNTKADFVDRVKHYQGNTSLFSAYQIEKQIEAAFHRIVKLPSGGSISIDPTEALISIDINSAKATSGNDIEDTALHTNLEAVEEIARQLRIRDLGGLIVIDFIDMSSLKNQREVTKKLKEALEFDRARVKVGNITRFGLLEMSRQRLRSYLGSSEQIICPRCGGNGSIRTVFPLTASLLRLLEEEAYKQKEGELQLSVPLEVATYLLNEKRAVLNKITNGVQVKITILPDLQLEIPQYSLKKIKREETSESFKQLAIRKKDIQDNGISIITENMKQEDDPIFEPKSLILKLKTWLGKLKNKLYGGEKDLVSGGKSVLANLTDKLSVNSPILSSDKKNRKVRSGRSFNKNRSSNFLEKQGKSDKETRIIQENTESIVNNVKKSKEANRNPLRGKSKPIKKSKDEVVNEKSGLRLEKEVQKEKLVTGDKEETATVKAKYSNFYQRRKTSVETKVDNQEIEKNHEEPEIVKLENPEIKQEKKTTNVRPPRKTKQYSKNKGKVVSEGINSGKSVADPLISPSVKEEQLLEEVVEKKVDVNFTAGVMSAELFEDEKV